MRKGIFAVITILVSATGFAQVRNISEELRQLNPAIKDMNITSFSKEGYMAGSANFYDANNSYDYSQYLFYNPVEKYSFNGLFYNQGPVTQTGSAYGFVSHQSGDNSLYKYDFSKTSTLTFPYKGTYDTVNSMNINGLGTGYIYDIAAYDRAGNIDMLKSKGRILRDGKLENPLYIDSYGRLGLDVIDRSDSMFGKTTGMNDTGQFVGYNYVGNKVVSYVSWFEGTSASAWYIVDLDIPGGREESYLLDVNNASMSVGMSQGSGGYHVFLYDLKKNFDKAVTKKIISAGLTEDYWNLDPTQKLFLNNTGSVAGGNFYYNENFGAQKISDLFPELMLEINGMANFSVVGLSDNSEIMINKDGEYYVLNAPVPEPATIVLMAVGGVALLRKRFKKA